MVESEGQQRHSDGSVGKVRVGSLFSGIGGIDLGFQRAGFEIAWQVEIDEWCRRVLAKHWPDVPKYVDVRDVGIGNVEPVDVLAGGFPCQDVSVAGKREGIREGNRSGLWFEFARLIRELRPRYAFVENVPGLLVQGMDRVLADLAEMRYDAEWQMLPAAAFGAPHIRDRVWVVAYPSGVRLARNQPTDSAAEVTRRGTTEWRENRHVAEVGLEDRLPDANSDRPQRQRQVFQRGLRPIGKSEVFGECTEWVSEPEVRRVVNGLPRPVDAIRGLGNSVVPQCVEWIARRIMEFELEKGA